MDLSLPAVGFLDSRVEDTYGRPPDVSPGPIALDKWDDGVIRHLKLATFNRDFLPPCGDFELCVSHNLFSFGYGADYIKLLCKITAIKPDFPPNP
jgi:hypothetical protein